MDSEIKPVLVCLCETTQRRINEAVEARERYLTTSPFAPEFEWAKRRYHDTTDDAFQSVIEDRSFGIGSMTCPDPQIALLVEIDRERQRLGMPLRTAVRIGYRYGAAWAALSSHPDSRFTEGACAGRSIEEALRSLLTALRETVSIEPAAEAL